MKNKAMNIVLLFSIPVLLSLSWVLSSYFLNEFSPKELTMARLLLATVILLVMFGFKGFSSVWTKKWMLGQVFLALTGRVGYFLASTFALESISATHALIVMNFSPLISIAIGTLLNRGKIPLKPLTLGLLLLSTIYSILTISTDFSSEATNFKGILLMFFALILFAVHLHFYQKFTEDKSMIDTLLFQFGFSVLILGPFHLDIGQKIIFLPVEKLSLFLFYAFVCNLVPFFIVHYLIKKVNYNLIQLTATLSPIFGILFSSLILNSQVQTGFLLNTLVTVFLVILTIYTHNISELNK